MKKIIAIFLLGGLFVNASALSEEVVFKDSSGRVLSKRDLKQLSGTIEWEIHSDRPVPAEAKKFHEMGRIAGQKGESESALSYFQKASKLAPDWPYPTYDAAFTYLLRKDFENAYASYKRVNELAPRGFFTAKTAANILEKERAGKLPAGIYLYYLTLEWEKDKEKRTKTIIALTEKVPNFAPGWKERAIVETNEKAKLAAIEKGLNADPDPETKGFLLINEALIVANAGKKEEAIKILGPLALDPTSPLDIETIAKRTIAHILEQ
jgi:tetratricopeptide (TPR) repeat protein